MSEQKVFCPSQSDCASALGAVHSIWNALADLAAVLEDGWWPIHIPTQLRTARLICASVEANIREEMEHAAPF